MKVLVCGGRNFVDKDKLFVTLDQIQEARVKITEICHGDAPGADTLAGTYAWSRMITCQVYPAQWEMYGNSAGSIRNQQMLTLFNPDLVVAFEGGKGTAHMIKISKARAIEVLEIK